MPRCILRRPRIHRPSPAMVVALMALFVAVGGSSYAAVQLSRDSVLSRHIKNGEVKRADLAKNAVGSRQDADGSLLAADFKAGRLSAGPRGAQGIPGPKGDSAATSLAVRAVAGTGVVTASCQPGERAGRLREPLGVGQPRVQPLVPEPALPEGVIA
jgi:hypothetical protein